ncbi:MAG: hypothetical protein IJY42_06400 [Clostridia bacterium]|nr:hypothetical protein [Clostridia bacterium]
MNPFASILKQYPYRTELHTHTSPVSACSKVTAPRVVALYHQFGCDALTITNHLNPLWMEGDPKERAREYLLDYELACEAAEGTGMRILFGVEIRFPENANDYLVYGVCPDDVEHFIRLLPYGIETFYKEAKTERNVILQAHPFRSNMELAPLTAIDGIESMNLHQRHNSKIAVATRYAKEHDLLVSGGSDFHQEIDLGLCVARTQQPLTDSYDIARIIQNRELILDMSGTVVIPYLYQI